MAAAGKQEMSADGRVGPGEGGKPGGVWMGSGRAKRDRTAQGEGLECCSLAHIWWLFGVTTAFNL